MKLISFACIIAFITLATTRSNALSADGDSIEVHQADPKIRQSILKGHQLNPHSSITKRMVDRNIIPAVSTDAYQQDQLTNSFAQFSPLMNSHVPPPSYNSINNNYPPPSYMTPPRPMMRCVRYPCPTGLAPPRLNSSPPLPFGPNSPNSRPSRHRQTPPRPPRRKEIYRDTSETEEQTTEREEAAASREEEREAKEIERERKREREQPEAEENEYSKPEKEENENEKNENEKPEKPEKEESENRPAPGEEP